MSKFCWNCGAEIDDNATQCSFCSAFIEDAQNVNQAPQDYQPTQGYQPPQNYQQPIVEPYQNNVGPAPVKEKKNIDFKSIIIAFVSVVVIAAVAAVASTVVCNSIGFRGMIKQAAKAYANGDYQTVMAYTSGLAYPYEDLAEYNEIFGEDFEEVLGDSIDELEDKLGSVKSISVKIESQEKLSDSKTRSLIKACCGGDTDNDFIVFNSDSITEVRKVNVILTVKGADKTKEYSIKKAYVVKENGQWRFLLTEDTTIKLPELDYAVNTLADF